MRVEGERMEGGREGAVRITFKARGISSNIRDGINSRAPLRRLEDY